MVLGRVYGYGTAYEVCCSRDNRFEEHWKCERYICTLLLGDGVDEARGDLSGGAARALAEVFDHLGLSR